MKKTRLSFYLLTLLLTVSPIAEAKILRKEFGIFGTATTRDNDDNKNFGGSAELKLLLFKRFGAALQGSYIRMSRSATNQLRGIAYGDYHLLPTILPIDLYFGAGLGYLRVQKINTMEASGRLGADFWLGDRLAVSASAAANFGVGNDPNPLSKDSFGFAGYLFNAGVRFGF